MDMCEFMHSPGRQTKKLTNISKQKHGQTWYKLKILNWSHSTFKNKLLLNLICTVTAVPINTMITRITSESSIKILSKDMRLSSSHLVVPLGQRVQEGQVAPMSHWWRIQVGHEVQDYQVCRVHLIRDIGESQYTVGTFLPGIVTSFI